MTLCAVCCRVVMKASINIKIYIIKACVGGNSCIENIIVKVQSDDGRVL